MGTHVQKVRAAIADLGRYGCDLTDSSIDDGIRTDDARFHLPYLEEHCGFNLTVEEVIDAARRMRATDGGKHQPESREARPMPAHDVN